jgi:dTDP-4-dehydrorhamnose reductase
MTDKEILILGAHGQLGKALQKHYPRAIAIDSDMLDISNQEAVSKYDFSSIKYILNAAAYTNVDGAETTEGRRTAWQVNAIGPRNLAYAAQKNDITLVHISTDYVFDGTNDSHTEEEVFSPLSVYGSSKAAGDIVIELLPKHYILRTSWVIGDGKNFVRTMLEVGKKGVTPSVVSDQIGRLTFTDELTRCIDHLLTSNPGYGTYNVSNDGPAGSWADITRKIFEIAGYTNKVSNINTGKYYEGKVGVAQRPLKSTLDLSKLKATNFQPIDWEKGLVDYVSKEVDI